MFSVQLRTKETLARAVRLVGGKLVSTGSLEEAGREFLTGYIEVRDGWDAAKLLLELSVEDSGDPHIRQVALDFRNRYVTDGDTARAIWSYVRQNVRFIREKIETFQSADYTLFAARAGDCDDHARAVFALASAAGLRARLSLLVKEGQPAHVCTQIFHDDAWHNAETTVPAVYGEDPRDAGKRLGGGRVDLFAKKAVTLEGISMGELLSSTYLELQPGARIRMAVERAGFVHTDSEDFFRDLGFSQVTTYDRPEDLPTDWPADQRAIRYSGTGAMVWADVVWDHEPRNYARQTSDYLIRAAALVPMIGPKPAIVPVLTKDWSDAAFTKLRELAGRRRLDPEALLMMLNSESGLQAWRANPHGAYGISQIMNLPGVGFHGTPDEYLKLSPEEQLPYVEAYYRSWSNKNLDTIERMYQANFLPATLYLGSDPSLVLVRKDGGSPHWNSAWKLDERLVYSQNAGLDHDHKGYITVGDLGDAARRAASTQRFAEALARLRQSAPSSPGRGFGVGGVAMLLIAAVAGVVAAQRG